MRKKIVSILLSTLMVLTLPGCAQTAKSKGTNKTLKSSNSAEIKKPDEITIMVDGGFNDKAKGQDETVAALEKLTGIKKIKVIQPDNSSYDDVVGQTLASGDWPDVITLPSDLMAGYAQQGVLWDMTDAWNNSDIKKRVKDDSVINSMKVNGKLYGFTGSEPGGTVTYIKQQWLDKVGMQVPKTYDDFLKVCEAFTTGDPDGNGVNGDTYALSAAGLISPDAPYTMYLPEFYQDAYPTFYKNDKGKWVDGFTEPGMDKALARLQDAYDKGYIDKETLTNGTDDCRNKFYEDRFGIFTYWAGSWAQVLEDNLKANGAADKLVAIPPLAKNSPYLLPAPGGWAITTKCKNPEGVYKYFLEPMLDGGKGQLLWSYGVEGFHWSRKAETVCGHIYKEGQFHMEESTKDVGTQFNPGDPERSLAPIDKIDNPMDEILSQDAIKSNDVVEKNSKTMSLVIPNDTMSQYNGDLQTLKSEIIANVVTQGMSIKDAKKKFKDEGGEKWSKDIVASLNKGEK